MLEADASLWDKYIRTNPLPEAKLIYDLHVGTPSPAITNLPPNYKKMVIALSTLRIDVVALMTTETIVIEVKPYAGPYAIGQVWSYTQLLMRDMPQLPNPVPMILTDKAAADTQWLCERLKVLLIELK